MARLCSTLAICGVLTALGPWMTAITTRAQSLTDELVVITHPSTGASSLGRNQLAALFSLSQRRWSTGAKVVAFNYAPGHALRITFDRAVLSMSPDEDARFWIERRVRGHGTAPRTVSSPRLMARVIARLPGAIGYVPSTHDTTGTTKVAWVRDGRVERGGAP